MVVLLLTSIWGFINFSRQAVGLNFVIYLLVGLIAFAPLPLLGYRAFALFRAQYVLNRDSLELRWGLRDEQIPLMDIEWVRPIQDLTYPVGLPSPFIPGALLGLRRHRDLGIVEFIASDRRNLLLVATAKRVYAISPADPAEFTQTFARAAELGSLSNPRPKSIYPSFVLTRGLGVRSRPLSVAGGPVPEYWPDRLDQPFDSIAIPRYFRFWPGPCRQCSALGAIGDPSSS